MKNYSTKSVLKPVLLALACSVPTFGTAHATQFADFRQVIVVTRNGNLPEDLQAATLESVSRSIQRGLLRGLGSELVGSGSGFKKRQETKLGSLMTAVTAVDKFMNEEAMPVYTRNIISGNPGGVLGRNQLGQLAAMLDKYKSSQGSISIEWMILPKDAKVPPTREGSIGAAVKDSALTAAAQLADLAKVGGTPADFDNALKAYDAADSLEIVDGDDAYSLYQDAFKAYKMLLTNDQLEFVPAHIRMSIQFAGGKMNFEVISALKPGHLAQQLAPPEGVVSPKQMEYLPHLSYNDDFPAVMRIGLSRQYGSAQDQGLIHVMFGKYVSADVRAISICRVNCKRDLTTGNLGMNYPTITGSFDFKQASKKPALRKAAGMLSSAVSGSDNFYILLQDIAIRVTKAGFVVDPKLTAVTLGVGDGKKQRQFNAATNAKVMGVDVGVAGFDVYSQILGPEVAKNLTTEVNNSMKAANADASDTLKVALQPVTDLLR